MRRRGAAVLALLLACGACVASGCAPRAEPAKPPAPTPLRVEPACDLAPAAGLSWVVDLRPSAIAEIPDLIPAIALILPEDRLEGFAASHGGIDLRRTKELCVARYAQATLSIARAEVDPERVARAFVARSTVPATRRQLATNPLVLALTGERAGEPERVLVLGRQAAALEQGEPGPMRAAEAFAFGRLKRSPPALRGAALARATQLLGDAPARALAPGPFEGESGRALGGLLRAATAVGGSARWSGTRAEIDVRLVLTGAWNDDAGAAGERLAAAVHVFQESAAGRLFGLDRPARAPVVRTEADALVLDATIHGDALARGLRDAVVGEVVDIMKR